ncbi:MAG: biopolymer transport protein ExbD [Parvibaculaceae bacterium]|jgi:biopolymer transport protein ExbD|nr:biopolymer transporter ExbD [Parvibaculaceae bacterium]
MANSHAKKRTMLFDEPVGRKRVVSLTPLIDVVFLLLIFFMLASTFLQTQTLTVITPAPDDSEEVDTDRVVIELGVHTDGHLTLDGSTVSVAALEDKLKARIKESPDAIVSVLAEKNAEVQPLIWAVDAARRAGADTVSTSRVGSVK